MSNFFTCNKWENPDSSIQTSFCVADKILLVVIVVFLIEILRQLYLYKRVHEIEWSDMRISLYSICILSLINQMIQLGVLNRDQESQVYFIKEIFRMIILFFLCFYYSRKAINLLENANGLRYALNIFACTCPLGLTIAYSWNHSL